MYVVILAGGGGTRLWPLSRQARPKPFLPLIGRETLFQRTVARVQPLVGNDGIYVVTERRHEPYAIEQAPGIPVDHVLAEPIGRNTAPAIALAALAIERPVGETMVVLPADAWVDDDEAFRSALLAAADGDGLANGSLGIEAPLVTLGVRPDRVETGYGHLVPRLDREDRHGDVLARVLDAFVEKPDAARAEELTTNGAAWNAGMFAWRRRAVLSALERFAPDVYDGVRLALMAAGAHEQGGVLDGPEAARRYAAVRSVSIDYAVMEPAAAAGLVVMTALDAGWSDVGSWRAVLDLQRALGAEAGREHIAGASSRAGAKARTNVASRPAAPPATVHGDSRPEASQADGPEATGGRGNGRPKPDDRTEGAGEAAGRVLDVGSRDILVRSAGGRLVATVGLSDTIVIDTPDALLVCAADRAQDVKQIVERLREAGETEQL